ncbi:hypothetical protein BS78_01G078300 [Paspalum vaginatum]|nr:hypothetical protein BS78_01G078300 [Paspalum vaginatum]KAJ1293567.1 hypothetical protein BS78_01G078300 [Paspalum vaginatum]
MIAAGMQRLVGLFSLPTFAFGDGMLIASLGRHFSLTHVLHSAVIWSYWPILVHGPCAF